MQWRKGISNYRGGDGGDQFRRAIRRRDAVAVDRRRWGRWGVSLRTEITEFFFHPTGFSRRVGRGFVFHGRHPILPSNFFSASLFDVTTWFYVLSGSFWDFVFFTDATRGLRRRLFLSFGSHF